MRLEDLPERPYNYEPVGATRTKETPPGFRRLEVRGQIGTGAHVFAQAAEAMLHWRMQQAAGIRIDASVDRIAVGAESITVLGFGRATLFAPCRVVWVDQGAAHVAFAYGTLTGHPEAGEESFVLKLEPDGAVWLTVAAYSRPATWYTRLAGPLARLMQRVIAGRYVARLRALAETSA